MKTSIVAIFAATAFAALLATPALAKSTETHWHDNTHHACLQIGRIWNWRAPNNRTLIVENDTHQKFKLDLMGYCPGLTFKETIAFKSIGGISLSCITPGDYIFFHDIGWESRCVIQKISAYTPAMEKADKAKKEKEKKND